MSDEQKHTEDTMATETVDEAVDTEQTSETENEEAIEKTELELLKDKLSEVEDQNLRLQAEIVNMRNRNKKDREDAAKYRAQDLATALLPAIDNLERALAIDVDGDQSEALKKGVQMVLDNLKQALKDNHIEVIQAVGEAFDPTVHQAVQTVPADDDHPADTVVEELQKGYCLYERVLRPSMVIVAQ